MMRVVFLDRATMGPDLELTRPGIEHEWVEYELTAAEHVVDRARGADIIITNKAPSVRQSMP